MCAALYDRLPIHRLHINLEPRFAQRLGRNDRLVVQADHVRRCHQNNRRPVIACFFQQFLGTLGIRATGQQVRSGLVAQGGGAAKDRATDFVVFRITLHRCQHGFLIQRGHRRLTHQLVVKRCMQEVRTPDGDIAQIIALLDDDILVARQDRHQVDLNLLKIVDLARRKRIQRGQRIGHRGPDHLVHIHDLTTSHPGCGFVARHIIIEFFIGHRHAGLVSVLIKYERAGADVFRDRLIGRGFGNPCRHDERRHRGLL